MKYFCGTVLILAAEVLQRHHAVADENDGRYTVERSLDDELALLLADNAEFLASLNDDTYRDDYSIELVSDKFILHIALYTLILLNVISLNAQIDDSLDEYLYEDEYDNDRRAVNETVDDYEDGDILDYYELPLQRATTTDNERHLAADCNSDEQYFKLVLKTDNYGFEESWTLMKREEDNGAWVMFATGPEEDAIYKDNKTYTGGESTTSIRLIFLFTMCVCVHSNLTIQCSLPCHNL